MKKVHQIPEGSVNLQEFFPEVYFPDVEEWKIQVFDGNNEIIATSSLNKKDLCCDIRFHFINSCGQLDSINFRHSEKTHETKADKWEKPQPLVFERINTGRRRQDIQSEDTMDFETSYYLEKDLPFLKDFVNSPLIFIEMEIENSNERDYVPFLIDDAKIPQKSKDVFEYQIQLKGALANMRINFR